MKILVLTNTEHYNFGKHPRGWTALPYFFTKLGNKVLALGKYDQPLFYWHYLKFKPDIIVSAWVPAGFVPAFFNKIGLISCPVVHAWDDYYAEQMTNYPHWLVSFLEKFTIKNSDFITTISKYNLSLAKKIGKPGVYIPNGVEKKYSKSSIKLSDLKTNKKNISVLYLGDQSPYKKVDVLVKAVNGIDADLFLLGNKNPDLEKIAGKNVHFIGPAKPEEVQSILKQADVLANASDQDSSFKFFEYIAAKKPILAYDGRPSYILTHKKDAYLTKDFKSAIIELGKNKKLRKKLTENVSKIKLYNWEEITKNYLRILEYVRDRKYQKAEDIKF